MSKLEIRPKLKYQNLKSGIYCNFPFLLLPLLRPYTLGFFFFFFSFPFPADQLAGEGGWISSPAKQQRTARRQRTVARPRRPRLAVAPATNQLPPAPTSAQPPTIDAAVKPRRSPALGNTFAGARRPSKQAGEEIRGERERLRGEREQKREKEKKRKKRERELMWGFIYEGFLVIAQKSGYKQIKVRLWLKKNFP